MRLFTFVFAILGAVMLSLFASEFGPGSFGDSALAGIPIWMICTVLAVGLTVIAIGQTKRSRFNET